MNIPSQEQIEELWKKCRLAENIKDHCRVVAKIAVFVAEKLKEKGASVNVDIVRAGALLHDLDKMLTLDKRKEHGHTSKRILEEAGFPEIANIAVFHCSHDFARQDSTQEERIVNYADKRVLHDKVVTLKERFDDAKERYPAEMAEHGSEYEELLVGFEKEIFKTIGIKPEELSRHLE
jgi:putative nucleotidyltransferase with HDIG domain